MTRWNKTIVTSTTQKGDHHHHHYGHRRHHRPRWRHHHGYLIKQVFFTTASLPQGPLGHDSGCTAVLCELDAAVVSFRCTGAHSTKKHKKYRPNPVTASRRGDILPTVKQPATLCAPHRYARILLRGGLSARAEESAWDELQLVQTMLLLPHLLLLLLLPLPLLLLILLITVYSATSATAYDCYYYCKPQRHRRRPQTLSQH